MPVYKIELEHTTLRVEAPDEVYLEELLNVEHGISPRRFQRLKEEEKIKVESELGDSQRPARVLR